MKEQRDCKIIRDLLPSYIDSLTNESTNQYIEEHLNNCEQCKKILEDMKKELKLNTTPKEGKEVKYIKKFNKKMKILKTLLVIFLIFVLSYARKLIIFISLSNKVSNYTNSTNYYKKSVDYAGALDDVITIETYVKDDKIIDRFKMVSEFYKLSYTNYFNGKTVNSYSETKYYKKEDEHKSRKTAELNKETELLAFIPNYFDISNPIMLFTLPLVSSIESDICNERDCYRLVLRLDALNNWR